MPANPSPAQSATSRLNGARSHGPATAAGRAILARAAMRHGLTGAFHLLPGEPSQEYQRRLALALAAIDTDDDAARAAAEALVQAGWRLIRWQRLTSGRSGSACAASPTTLKRYHARLLGEWRRSAARLSALQAGPGPKKLRGEPEMSAGINHMAISRTQGSQPPHASPERARRPHAEPEPVRRRNEPTIRHARPEPEKLRDEPEISHGINNMAFPGTQRSQPPHASPEPDGKSRNEPSRPLNRHQRRRAAKLARQRRVA